MMIGYPAWLPGYPLSGTRFVPRIEEETNKRVEDKNAKRKTGEEMSNDSRTKQT
jgi:hypothetical protein